MKLSCICIGLGLTLCLLQCSEYLGRKPERLDPQLLEVLRTGLSSAVASQGCGSFSVAPIRGGVGTITGNSNGSRNGFNVYGCRSAQELQSLGFGNQNFSFTGDGVSGNSAQATLVSNSDYSTLGSKSQSFEVTFRLDRADAYLDAVLSGSATNATFPVGPRIRITPDGAQPINSEGAAQSFSSPPRNRASVSQIRTYCFDLHDHSGGHLIGWSQPCANLTDRDRQIGNYEFDRTGIQGILPGFRVGLVLNGATVRQLIPGEMIAPH